MTVRIGGWTRIWLVLSSIFFILSLLVIFDNLNRKYRQADEDYQLVVNNAEWYRTHPQEVAEQQATCKQMLTGRPADSLAHVLCDAENNSAPDLTSAAAKRDAQKNAASVTAWKDAFIGGASPSVILGALFAAIGWIRAGFRKGN